MNNLNIQIKVADYKGLFEDERIEIKDYVYWNVLKEAFNEELILIKRNPDIVQMVKEIYEKCKEEIEHKKFEIIDKIPFEPVKRILKQKEIRDIVLSLPDKKETIQTLIYESMAVGQVKASLEAEIPKLKLEAYASGQMVKVEKGDFLYGEEKTEKNIDYDYEIDVFPVTNAGYCMFLNKMQLDDKVLGEWIDLKSSYGNEKCRIKKDKGEYNVENGYETHPVVYVSWYGAEEFAKWEGKRLPTEEEWEKAARGPKGWVYPWGDNFDKSLCNSDGSDIGGTTEMDKYPDGKSYYGCYDMSGNVWELAGSKYDKDNFVLCDGSWLFSSVYCRCAYRFRFDPDLRFNLIGFRCARTVK